MNILQINSLRHKKLTTIVPVEKNRNTTLWQTKIGKHECNNTASTYKNQIKMAKFKLIYKDHYKFWFQTGKNENK